MRYKAVIFDLDGTLLDTLDDLASAANAALQRFGFPTHPSQAYRQFVGDGSPVLIQRALPPGRRDPATREHCLKAFLEIYARNWDRRTRPYDGIPEMLDALAAENVKMAILSNKPHAMALETVAKLLPRWHFKPLLGHRQNIPRKPDPAGALEIARHLKLPAADFIFLGDSGVDMQTARAAGMLAAGALWGFRSEDELQQAGAQTLIAHPRQVLEFLK